MINKKDTRRFWFVCPISGKRSKGNKKNKPVNIEGIFEDFIEPGELDKKHHKH